MTCSHLSFAVLLIAQEPHPNQIGFLVTPRGVERREKNFLYLAIFFAFFAKFTNYGKNPNYALIQK